MEQKILVIDDLRLFEDFDPQITWYARNSREAIELAFRGPYTETWWDHDLGGSDTSMRVLDYIDGRYHSEGNVPNLGACFVHTANPVGAQALMAGLGRYYNTRRVNVFSMNVSNIEA